jgi:outer membrane protein TolC
MSLAMSRDSEVALRTATEAATNAALLARDRYASGLIDFQTLLNTERTVLTLADSLAATQAERASALIRLYKALGGGWPAGAISK